MLAEIFMLKAESAVREARERMTTKIDPRLVTLLTPIKKPTWLLSHKKRRAPLFLRVPPKDRP